MKITERLKQEKKTLFSYEIIPPKRGGSIDYIYNIVEKLLIFEPPFIDLTSRSAEVYYEDLPDNIVKRHIKRKRPGTIGLSAALKNRYNVETVPHLLCTGFTREETEDALIELNYLGINNVLAVRGDELRKGHFHRDGKTHNRYASDLVKQITDMNKGIYLENLDDAATTDFCIGVGGYPEKHFEAPNMNADLKNLKQKVDAGADYIVTQMVFDNKVFFDFVERCRIMGIDIPIIPGIKILTVENHLRSIPRSFHVEIPQELSDKVTVQSAKAIKRIGIDWTIRQCNELIENNVPCLHFYILNSANEVAEVVSQF